ncbi:peptidase [Endozoicomonas montiporae]|uniref:Peptidase n=1 Tax=Endozoicomonas montiporae TaxID=1027273 RepID=A0A081NB12_9GAMM|nr:protease SohB [Endozoicomonas montiporae]KEQ15635.1 peptidase [Endozoicomonas montiporae]
MEYLAEYGLFLAKALTVIVALVVVVVVFTAAGSKAKKARKGHLEIDKLNDHYKELREGLEHSLLTADELKQQAKDKKKQDKADKAAKKKSKDKEEKETRPRLYVLDFQGDIKASATSSLREEITAVLGIARKEDEVLVRLESGGGLVHSYGLASSQLQRIRDKGIKLTIAVDKVAASGGYMMACTADKILAAPFAVIGSIGVMAQLPNLNKLLKKHDVDIELHTAGEYKRTLTVLGENTEKGREKFKQDMEDTHQLFKDFVQSAREQVTIEEVATGEIWYGQKAIEKNLVDEIKTSDQYIYDQVDSADIIHVAYTMKKGLPEKLGLAAHHAVDTTLLKWWERLSADRVH